jgi:enamine deaminase RidA (YjgF/YER057c/UK114 family)
LVSTTSGVQTFDLPYSTKPDYPYSIPAVLVPPCPTLYIQGQVAWGEDHVNLVGGLDVKEQTRQIFRNLENLLEQAGGTLDDIVQMLVFMLEMDRFEDFLEVRKEFYPHGKYPPCTGMGAPRMAQPDLRIEIHATAALTGLASS